MIGWPHHRAERGKPVLAERPRMSLARIEEPVPHTMPAILRQQQALGKIEYFRHVVSGLLERRAELIRLTCHGRCRCCPDNPVTIEGSSQKRPVRRLEPRQVLFLVCQVSVVKVGKDSKNPDP
jgi:hypothetical protein